MYSSFVTTFHFDVDQNGFLPRMHPTHIALQVRVVGANTGPGKQAQCHPYAIPAQNFGRQVVAQVEQ